MEKKVYKTIQDIITIISNSYEFKKCNDLKEKLDKNREVKDLVNTIKKLQKDYVRTMDDEIKGQLAVLEDKLNNIPLYVEFEQAVAEVNKKIDFVKDELNNYFYTVVNPEK